MAYHTWTVVCAPILDTYLVSPHGQGCGTSIVHMWSVYTTSVCIFTEVLRCPAVGHVLAWWLCCCKMRPGSACGGWLFAVTVYWIMVTVAR